MLFSTLVGILVLMPFLGTGLMNAFAAVDYTNPQMVNALKTMQIINMAGGLLLPALLYMWLVDGDASPYLKRSLFPGWVMMILAVFLILAAQPFISFTTDQNGRLQLPSSFSGFESWMKSTEHQAQLITDAFLGTTTIPGLLLNIFMIQKLVQNKQISLRHKDVYLPRLFSFFIFDSAIFNFDSICCPKLNINIYCIMIT